MPTRTGLLTPQQIITSETTGLLHHPDLLLQQLLQQGLLMSGGRGRGPTKEQLDPYGISGVKLDRPWSEIPFTRVPSGTLIPRQVMTPHQFYEKHKGGVLLSTAGDKSAAGERLTSIGGNPVDQLLWGGGGFMRKGREGVWASELPRTTSLSNRISAAQREHDTENVLLTHATMGPRAIDFSQHPSTAMVQMLPYTKISRAGQKAVKDRMAAGITESTAGGGSKRYSYPDFPGIYSPKLPEWLAESGTRRKHFVKLMDSREMLEAGVPSPGYARLATSDIEQLALPWLSSGMEIARVQPGLRFDPQTRHPAYPVETPGKYEGSLGRYVPPQIMFQDWWRASQHKPPQRAMRSLELGGASQAITQPWLDRLMRWWSGGR